jgi:hypothetical protein
MRIYEPYCLSCNGGGKSLGTFTSAKAANQTATSHMASYGCNVTILKKDKS